MSGFQFIIFFFLVVVENVGIIFKRPSGSFKGKGIYYFFPCLHLQVSFSLFSSDFCDGLLAVVGQVSSRLTGSFGKCPLRTSLLDLVYSLPYLKQFSSHMLLFFFLIM